MNQFGYTRGSEACQCKTGFMPELTQAGDNRQKCVQPVSCAVSGVKVGFIATDGFCKCFGDFYDFVNQLGGTPSEGSCLPNCRKNVCSGHGSCQSDPTTTDSYNSQCKCDVGWRTSSYQKQQNNLYTEFGNKKFCDIPYDPNYQPRGKNCGFWANEKIGPLGQNCAINPIHFSIRNQLQEDANTKLFVRICPKSSNSKLSQLQCSGVQNGDCVADKYSGSYCQCKNGFIGSDCSQLTCPSALYKNGVPCNGVGACDNPTIDLTLQTVDAQEGRCICKESFYGNACEKIVNDCAASQAVQSYPNRRYFPQIY